MSSKYLSYRLNNLVSLILLSVTILPLMTLNSELLKENFKLGITPSDNFYSTRIYSMDNRIFELGDFYVESTSKSNEKFEFFSLAEVIQRMTFKFVIDNPITNYYSISLLILILWIYMSIRIISDYDLATTKSILLAVILIIPGYLIFFSNFNLLDSNYVFARLVSPQWHGLFWLLSILFGKQIITSSRGERSLAIIFLVLLLLISPLIYPFLFLTIAATSFILIVHLFRNESKKEGIYLSGALIIVSILVLSAVNNRTSNTILVETSQRHGLLESRLPGALGTTLISIVALLVIVANRTISSRRLNISSTDLVLVFPNLGVLLACQSNVITGKSVQFSDHFNTFAYINLTLSIGLVLSEKLKKLNFLDLLTKYKLVITLSLLATSSLSLMNSKGLYDTSSGDSPLRSIKGNVIVDAKPQQDFFPAFHNVKLLFDNSIFLYAYSDEELMERLFVSSGCPAEFKFGDLSPILGYRFAPYEQRAERWMTFKGNRIFGNLVDREIERLLYEAQERRTVAQKEFEIFKEKFSEANCLELATKWGINFVIFDKISPWNRIVEVNGLKPVDFRDERLDLIKLAKFG
jgi:hypothetical protein